MEPAKQHGAARSLRSRYRPGTLLTIGFIAATVVSIVDKEFC